MCVCVSVCMHVCGVCVRVDPSRLHFKIACVCLFQGPVQNQFESIQHGSIPPKIVDISCHTSPDGSLVSYTFVLNIPGG